MDPYTRSEKLKAAFWHTIAPVATPVLNAAEVIEFRIRKWYREYPYTLHLVRENNLIREILACENCKGAETMSLWGFANSNLLCPHHNKIAQDTIDTFDNAKKEY